MAESADMLYFYPSPEAREQAPVSKEKRPSPLSVLTCGEGGAPLGGGLGSPSTTDGCGPSPTSSGSMMVDAEGACWEGTPLRSPEQCETPTFPGGNEPATPTGQTYTPVFVGPPPTPLHKRANPRVQRTDSLNETKVLMALQRTESVVNPALFRFEEHFVFVRMLGATPTSEVWHVRQKSDGSAWALKKSRHDFRGRADRARLMSEIESVAGLPPHPHIVNYKRAWQQDSHLYTQMELCQGGTLRGLMEQNGGRLSEPQCWVVLGEIASALKVLAQGGVLHLDIKPDNIFVDLNGRTKLGDFGSAVGTGPGSGSWEEGDGRYVAPELLDESASPSSACDVFSLGASVFHAAHGSALAREWTENRDEFLDASLGAFAASGVASPGLVEMLRACLRRQPTHRPQPTQLVLAAQVALSAAS